MPNFIGRPGDEKSGHIFLYALVIYDAHRSQLCINSMLSESHNSNAIFHWLTEWLRLGGSTPHEFVSDMSLALLNAAVRAFAMIENVNAYNERCFRLLRQVAFEFQCPKHQSTTDLLSYKIFLGVNA